MQPNSASRPARDARAPRDGNSMSGASAELPPSDEALWDEARLLHWFGQETIAFNRGYVDLTGNVLSALWLSYVLDRLPALVRAGRATADADAYRFCMSGLECEHATGITRAQQATCRRQLVDAGLLSEDGTRGRTVSYTIHMGRLRERMTAQAAPLHRALVQARAAESAHRAPRTHGRAR
ncbi:hypothetical protein VAR608DRAFT_5759 [Variovorax sp. HW608]|nr:hypothetical protein VAR608DRAFT_5759 [Variovorax sp. HW608]